jgi:rfaE bifunctional protein kinase chain/domain
MILVIGDIIVDEFIWGNVHRISPEAPVPVVNVENVDRRLGGSANVIRNLHALDISSAMFGVVGNDEPGNWVHHRLGELNSDDSGVFTKQNGRPTAIKTRVIAQHQQIVRYDRESTAPINQETQNALIKAIRNKAKDASAVILSDYAKGVLTPELLRKIIPELQGKIIGVDPKPSNTEYYHDVTFITPNLLEASQMANMAYSNDDAHVEIMAKHLHQKLGLEFILITRSERGMTLFDGTSCTHIPTAARDVFDVTGAGDTVIAVFTASLARGETPLEAAKTANLAAGVVVGKVGTATADWNEINNMKEGMKHV